MSWEADVLDLMRKIETQLNIPVDVQRLYHQGKLLYPYSTDIPPRPMRLDAYAIQHAATVHLNLGIAVCAELQKFAHPKD
jgi:hypothetical protein